MNKCDSADQSYTELIGSYRYSQGIMRFLTYICETK